MEEVILIDSHDNQIGVMEKMQAHREARLHRAFSVFVFNSSNKLMLHKRAPQKYHSGGLWTNTCCSHPRPGEHTEEATHRRLMEEMGFTCLIKKNFHFTYCRKLDNELTENELDHVFTGFYDNDPILNPEEVEDWKWISKKDLLQSIEKTPEIYTEWFKIIVLEYSEKIFPS